MRGIEAVNVIIILVLAVITIFAIMLLFMGVLNPVKTGTSLQAATQSACLKLRSLGCPSGYDLATISVDDFDANNDGKLNPGGINTGCASDESCDNLYMLCQKHYGCMGQSTNSDFQRCCSDRVCGCSS